MLFSHGIVCLLLGGLLAGASGWLLRRLVTEAGAASAEALRAKLLEAVSAIASLRERREDDARRVAALGDELTRERAVADEARRLAAELEATTGLHEQHIVALADEGAERDRETRTLQGQLAALQQQVRRLDPFAARYREAELKADAVARDRDTQVAALRARADELESRLRDRPESERVRKAGA